MNLTRQIGEMTDSDLQEGNNMNQMTQSFSAWCFKFHPEIYSLLRFGHAELFTKEMQQEYIDWVQTDEGRQYLKGGSKYREKDNAVE